TLVVGECTAASEHTWNAVGQRRLYVATGSSEYYELPYVQPPVEWDAQTGLAADGAGNVPEHLMVDFFRVNPDKERVSAAVGAIYLWNNIKPRTFFASHDAYVKHRSTIETIQHKFDDFMFASGQMRLLSAKEQDGLRKVGI